MFYRFLHELGERLRQTRDDEGLLRHAVRAASEEFDADAACLATIEAGEAVARPLFALPREHAWDAEVATAFARGDYPGVTPRLIGATVWRRGRPWGALLVQRRERAFESGDGRNLAKVAAMIGEALDRLDRARLLDVRDRLDRKIMEQIRPRDLFYQLLHGLRTITRYDHSSALLIGDDDESALELVAEQLACVKGKSRYIGRKLALSEPIRKLMREGGVYGFDRRGQRWTEWGGSPQAAALAELLDYNRDAPAGERPREACMVCAALATRRSVIGVLKISAMHSGTLGKFEREAVRQFSSQASVAIQYLQRTGTLERQMLAAERKHAFANIARGVSHDVNNALGAVLPLVQQLRADLAAGELDLATLGDDLKQIEQSLQVSRRIFGGMLALARGSARSLGEGNVRRAIDGALEILHDGLQRRKVQVRIDAAENLPSVAVGQGDLTQLFLNLASNARDAMPDGGELHVRAQRVDARVEVEIRDNGVGMAIEQLARVGEPFYSTKADGNGLGLSICRSIVFAAQGDLRLESKPGLGTTVRVWLPIAAPRSAEA
ncbi:MAG: ATP-binding protein [Phycisphaerae bacterium]